MMKPIRYFSLVLITVLIGWMTRTLAMQGGGGFIIQNADGATYFDVQGSSELNTIIQNVPERFIYERADEILYNDNVVVLPQTLTGLIQNVEERFVYDRADAISAAAVNYPRALINDTTPPTYVDIERLPSTNGTVSIAWTTTEFTTSTIRYGTQPGQYSNSQTNNDYQRSGTFLITGVEPGQTYYFRLTNVDRNANTVQSPEGTFQNESHLYLPLVKRR